MELADFLRNIKIPDGLLVRITPFLHADEKNHSC